MPSNQGQSQADPKSAQISKAEFQLLREIIQKKGTLSFEVLTDSMSPLIQPGMKIQVTKLPEDFRRSIVPYDIIAFWDLGKIKCHYVFQLNQFTAANGENSVVTRGLNLQFEDFPVLGSEILGVVTNFRISALTKIFLSIKKWIAQ